jgi:Carbohydrate-binding module 48 (Isoamylase N-terminal domain)
VTDRELRDLLDARPDAARAERALSALPPARRARARALLAVSRSAGAQPRPVPSAGFADRAMARVRAAPPPRRGVLDRLLSLGTPLAGPLAVSAAAAFLALAVARYPTHRPDAIAPGEPPPARARLALVAPAAREVRVAGDFNGWRPETTPLARDPDGRWRVEIPVERGRRYEYMFVVDGAWVTDPSAPAHAADGFGGQNAILDT